MTPLLPSNPFTITPVDRVRRDGHGATDQRHLAELRAWDSYERVTNAQREAAKERIRAQKR